MHSRKTLHAVSLILTIAAFPAALTAQPAPSPGVPDFHMKWTVDAVGGGEWPNDAPGAQTGVASRFLNIHQSGETYVDTDSVYRADPFYLTGIWDSFETWTATYVCGVHPTAIYTGHVVYETLNSGSQPRDGVLISVGTAPDGSLFIPDPFLSSGFRLLAYPSTYLDVTTANGADCNGPLSSTQTLSLPADGVPPTFLPGDIPATDASGAHFARDSYLTYYVDPYSLVPVVFHFHVEITDLNQCSPEVCDGVDNDCDGQIDEDFDTDSDTYTTCGEATNVRTNGLPGGGDCNDGNAGINPGATEFCNGVDEDCDIAIDEDFDADSDTHTTCGETTNVRTNGLPGGGDCNDSNAGINPGATESCNGVDEDCDISIDEDFDTDGDTYTTCGDFTNVRTNGLPGSKDCNDGKSAVHPGATEDCNGDDDDCDGSTDEGNPGGGLQCGGTEEGECSYGLTHCQDGQIHCVGAVGPSAEQCDVLDNDCDGSIDDGNPGGGASCDTGQPGVCSAGTTVCASGSVSCSQNVPPSAESCDTLDNDCDNVVDEGVCASTPLLTSLSPAKVWVGLQNAADAGLRFDLAAKVYLNDVEVGSGQLNSAPGGSSGFDNAKLDVIKLSLSAPVPVPPGSSFRIDLLVRNACRGSGRNSGEATLWYNGQPTDHGPREDAGSRFDARIGGTKRDYFLRESALLSTTAGTSRLSVDQDAGSPCSDFKSFGTWSTTLP